jgi:hypothetical protein
MRKERFYDNLINDIINNLIDKKDNLIKEIEEISTTIEYHSFEDKTDLTKYDISEINNKREDIIVIYELISNIEKIRR